MPIDLSIYILNAPACIYKLVTLIHSLKHNTITLDMAANPLIVILGRVDQVIAPTATYSKLFMNIVMGRTCLSLTTDEAAELCKTHVLPMAGDAEALSLIASWVNKSTQSPAAGPVCPGPQVQDVAEIGEHVGVQDKPEWDGAFVLNQEWKNQFFTRTLLTREKRPYSQATLSSMKSSKIWQRMGPTPLKDVDDSFAKLIESHQADKTGLGSLLQDLTALKMYLRPGNMTAEERHKVVQDPMFEQKLEVFYDSVCDDIEDAKLVANQNATGDERACAMPWEEIVKRVQINQERILSIIDRESRIPLDCSNPEGHDQDLEACLYTCLTVLENKGSKSYDTAAPRRRDYFKLRSDNYDAKTRTVNLREYKTSHVFGDYSFQVSANTARLIDVIIKLKGDRPLFTRLHGDWTKTTRQYFQMITGKPLYNSLIRHLYITYRQLQGTLVYQDDKEELARRMGHSVNMQQDNYTKRGLLDDWYAEHPDDTLVNETDNDTIVLSDSDVDEADSTSKPKRKRGGGGLLFTPEENEQLEMLLKKHDHDLDKLQEEATAKQYIIARRNKNQLRVRMRAIATTRIANKQDLGTFARVTPSQPKNKKTKA